MWGKEMVCARCGTVGKPKQRARGSFGVEVVMWLLLIVPGIIYSAWRSFSGTIKTCRACRSEELVPLDSPRGKQLIAQLGRP